MRWLVMVSLLIPLISNSAVIEPEPKPIKYSMISFTACGDAAIIEFWIDYDNGGRRGSYVVYNAKWLNAFPERAELFLEVLKNIPKRPDGEPDIQTVEIGAYIPNVACGLGAKHDNRSMQQNEHRF